MEWITKNKAEQLFKDQFRSKRNMAKELGISRNTLSAYLSDPNKLNSKIKMISNLTGISEMKLFKAINN
jgi:DNA-binding XRE family transcriptional regulator